MKSLHVPFVFYPDVVGGTEVYVAALAQALARQHHPAVVAAPAKAAAHYVYGGTPVYRFPTSEHVANVAELYGEGDAVAAEAFARILERERPDIVHLHAFTRACSLLLVRQARAFRIPVVFTYHTPTVSCARGTLMLWGAAPCDGLLSVTRCSACALEGLGVPKPLAQVLGRVPASSALASANLGGRTGTAIRFSSLTRMRQSATRALFAEVDTIVAFRDWVAALLAGNGVPAAKIVRSTHALCHPIGPRREAKKRQGPLRLAFLGRLDRTKGIDVLIRAVGLTRADIVLDVYGAAQGDGGHAEAERLRELAVSDARVSFKPALDPLVVVETLASYDALAVPSQWMETGPLVVLEAFAAGIPVIGSAIGGIQEMVRHERNGLLIRDHRSSAEWATALARLATEPGLLQTLARNVTPPKSMDEVATEMLAVYETLVRTEMRPASSVSSVA